MITIDKSDRHSCVMNKRLCVTFQQDTIPFFLSYANVVCVQPFTTATALIPVISPFAFFVPYSTFFLFPSLVLFSFYKEL